MLALHVCNSIVYACGASPICEDDTLALETGGGEVFGAGVDGLGEDRERRSNGKEGGASHCWLVSFIR